MSYGPITGDVAIVNLTEAEEVFAGACLTERTRAAAYIRAWPNQAKGRRVMDIQRLAGDKWRLPHIQKRIGELRKVIADATVADARMVLREWLDIAMADPNELSSFRRDCCRHCHGEDHRYQWVSETEWRLQQAKAIDDKKKLPDREGGYGYDPELPPNAKCPVCHGRGIGHVHVNDTRLATGPAAKLYAGVKQTKNGIEVVMRDQDAALMNVARFLGMFEAEDKNKKPTGGAEFLAELQKHLPN